MRPIYRYRSFFWPALLILLGVIALLANTGQIPADRLYNLLSLWPLILVVLGLELIVRRTMRGVGGDIAAALIILLAIVGATAYVAASPSVPASQSLDSTAELGSISAATLEIDAGAAEVTVAGSSDIGSNLYRLHIDYSGPKPDVSMDRSTGELVISQQGNNFFAFGQRRFVVNVQLNPNVPWTITQNTGAATSTFKLANLHVSGLSLNTGASRDEITLGPPSGKVSVQVHGGSLTVRVHRPSETPVSVSVSGGAISLAADGRNYHGFGSQSYSSTGFDSTQDGYRVEINGGACNVTVDTATPSG
jgi:hypothetical protein